MISIIASVCIPVFLFFRRGEKSNVGQLSSSVKVQKSGAYLVLFSLFFLNLAVGLFWTFIERLGIHLGYTGDAISNVLLAGNLISLISCLICPWLMSKIGLRALTMVVLILSAIADFTLTFPSTLFLYAIAVIIFIIAWTSSTTLLFMAVPLYDPIGRYTSLSVGFLGFGFALGSVVGGAIVEGAEYSVAFSAATVCGVIAVLLYGALRYVQFPSAVSALAEPST